MNNNNNNSPSDHGYSIKGIEVSPPLTTKKMRKNSPQASSNNGGLRVNTSVDRFGQLARSPFIGVNAIDNGQLPQVTTPNSATIDIKHFEQLAIDLVDRDLTSPSVRPKNQQPLSSSSSEESFDGTAWLGTGPSTQFFPPSSFVSTPSPRSPVSSSGGGDCEDEDELTELERLRRENEELKRKLAAVSQIAIDTILNQPKLSEAGMTNDQIKQSRKEAVAAVAAACGISKSRAQKEAKRRWLEGKDKDELIHHYQVTTNNKTKRTIIGILKKRNEMDLVKELKKDLKSPKKQELDS